MFKRIAIVAVALLACAPALAHETWITGEMVDPATKVKCCGEDDCHLIAERRAHPTSAGYYLDDTGETIEWSRVQPSPDGGIWACRWGGETKCFFAPSPSF